MRDRERKDLIAQMKSDCEKLDNDLKQIICSDKEFTEIDAENTIFVELDLPSVFQDMANRTERGEAIESMEIIIQKHFKEMSDEEHDKLFNEVFSKKALQDFAMRHPNLIKK